MAPLIEIKEVDRRFYSERLRAFLPEKLIDVHTHVWRSADYPSGAALGDARTVNWPGRVAAENPIEDLLESYRLMLPGKQVTPLIFPSLPENNLGVINDYASAASRQAGVPALIFSHPAWSGEEFERCIREGGFLGAKSYLTVAPAYLPTKEIRILDYFPPHQLEVLNRHGWIMMLHIPRDGRLQDPVNLAQMLEIERTYPQIKLIIAHVGRAYCNHDVGNAFEVLAASKTMYFDFSANTNDWVFEQLLRCVGPQRVLYGTDMPILRMRMRRVTEGDHYVNLVPKGLYGDVSGDKNMGEVEGEEAEKLTFFLYEEIDAFRRAAERVGLSCGDVEDVFYNNAKMMIESAKAALSEV